MIGLDLNLEGDGAWTDLKGKEIIDVGAGFKLAVLDAGMTSRRPSVAIRIDLPDGRSVIAQTSARLFCSAARAIAGRYPNLFADEAH